MQMSYHTLLNVYVDPSAGATGAVATSEKLVRWLHIHVTTLRVTFLTEHPSLLKSALSSSQYTQENTAEIHRKFKDKLQVFTLTIWRGVLIWNRDLYTVLTAQFSHGYTQAAIVHDQ